MKKKIRLTESELISLINKVIKEEKHLEQHLEYEHPRAEELELENGGMCTIQIAKHKIREDYSPVLICTKFGQPMVNAELPVRKESKEEVKIFICNNIERTYELLDEMLGYETDYDVLSEGFSFDRFEVDDDPIVCSSDLF